MPTPGGALVRIGVAQRALGLRDPKTLRTWIRKGTIDGLKLNGKWYVKRESLNKILNTQGQMGE